MEKFNEKDYSEMDNLILEIETLIVKYIDERKILINNDKNKLDFEKMMIVNGIIISLPDIDAMDVAIHLDYIKNRIYHNLFINSDEILKKE